ncbi:MarR family transcriptional regulator [Streptomyces sp. NPDC001984]
MGVQVRGVIAARGTAVRSLRQVIAQKRLSRRMREEGQPFEPALLFPLLVIVLDSVAAFVTSHLQFYRLIGAAPALAAAIFPVAGTAWGLSMAASSVLGRIGREGPQRVTELARAEGVSQPGMTQLVTRMEHDGLVRRIASTDDRRGVLVEATDAGVDLVRQRRAERTGALRELMDRLDPQEQSAVLIAFPALAQLIQAEESK